MRYIMKYSILIAYLFVASCQPKAPQAGPQDHWLEKYSQHSIEPPGRIWISVQQFTTIP